MHDRRRRAALILAAAAAAAACVAVVPSASAATARPAGSAQRLAAGNPWGRAQEVPGTAALNKGDFAGITSVSCASAGNCSAGGYYTDRSVRKVFVVSEVHGTWRKAEEVPGTGPLNNGHKAGIAAVSCASAGNCSAGGWFRGVGVGGSQRKEAFVVSEVHGTWRKAEEVPGTAALNKEGHAQVTSVSCASAGNCVAGGYYASGHRANGAYGSQAFVVSEVRGTWRKAEEVPGTAALNVWNGAGIASVSCASAGNCSAGGYYVGVARNVARAFAVSEVNGTWRKAERVTVPSADLGFNPVIASVSCGSAGNCSAGGWYLTCGPGGAPGCAGIDGSPQAFVVSEVNGTWRKIEDVPGDAALNTGQYDQITSVSCASAGNCSAGGYYFDASLAIHPFVVSEVNGTWQTAEEVPGDAALNTGGNARITSVSCASAGNCSAGGDYTSGSAGGLDIVHAFVVSEINGTWQTAEEVPGTAALSKGRGARITSVSCGSAGHCSAGGYYLVHSGSEAFVANRK